MSQILLSAEQSRRLDQRVIEQGTPASTLMRRAAEALQGVLERESPEARRIVIFAGGGNNAGDGYLLATLLHAVDKEVRVVQLMSGDELQGEARVAFEQAQNAGVSLQRYASVCHIEEDVVVDALLGTGLSRPPQGDWADAIRDINQSAATVYAVDVPSGLLSDTGVACEPTVRADHTVSFIARKRGLYTAEGPDYSGVRHFDDLGVDRDLLNQDTADGAELLCWEDVRAGLPARRHNSHKGDYGHVWVIGGAAGYAGAAELCSRAALRCGSGRVSQVQPECGQAGWPEIMRHVVRDRKTLTALIPRDSVVAIGPGLGRDGWAREMLSAALEHCDCLILDADALHLLAAEPVRREDWILTPHPGEATAMLGRSTKEVQQDRFSAARDLHQRYGGTVVLKGCGTLIDDGEAAVGVAAQGHPGMATAGMGDVLTGVIASLLGQGVMAAPAARMGVCLHGAAAEDAGREGARGLIASDLLPSLRARVSRGE